MAAAGGHLAICCWSMMENFVPNEITIRVDIDMALCLRVACYNKVP